MENFNPLKEKGIPIEKQTQNWLQLNTKPYNKNSVDPYTRTSVILMNGIETEAVLFSHQFSRHTNDIRVRQKLALLRRIEQEQQKAINWMLPANESHIELTIGYEQVAVDLTAFLASTEPDSYVKAALEFALLEDFDHLYRFANLLELEENKDASLITKNYTEITVGRPTFLEHRHPYDDVRKFINCSKADPLTKMHILTITAAEQQTMNFYMNIGNRSTTVTGRALYQEIAQVEEQHVTHYGSLMDPNISWFEHLLLHEYNECYLYYSLMKNEKDEKIRAIWEKNLAMEIEHLHIVANLIKKHDKIDPEKLLPDRFPPLFQFQSNIEYIRKILSEQFCYNAKETKFVTQDKITNRDRYYKYQESVNDNWLPSKAVIKEKIIKDGSDYRQELMGPHPIKDYQKRHGI